jgi:hypothetical protein
VFCDTFGGTEDIGNPTADQVKSFKPQAPNSNRASMKPPVRSLGELRPQIAARLIF